MPEHNRFSSDLKAQAAGEWKAAHEDHPFVRSIGGGTLGLDRFRYFMRQDYLFLIDYSRVMALAAAKSTDLGSMSWWAQLLNGTLNSEMALHRSFCQDFGISLAELEATRPAPATVAYTRHLLTTAYSGGIADIAVSVLPCQWGYDEIGRRLAADLKAPEGSLHARWVAGYNSPEYQEGTAWLRAFVDEQGTGASDADRKRWTETFITSTRYERLFWDAAWNLEQWPS